LHAKERRKNAENHVNDLQKVFTETQMGLLNLLEIETQTKEEVLARHDLLEQEIADLRSEFANRCECCLLSEGRYHYQDIDLIQL